MPPLRIVPAPSGGEWRGRSGSVAATRPPGELRQKTREGDRVSGSNPRETLRASLSGPTSISVTGWLTALIPASLLVVVQEVTTPFPQFGFVLLSAGLQHVVDGVFAGLAIAMQRVAPRLDKVLVRFALWTAIGVSRGLVGGTLAAEFADVDPDYGYRVAFWLLVTWTWMPTIGYTLAQFENRRRLLGIRDAEGEALERKSAQDVERRDSLRARLLSAVQASVGPAVEEIRVRLLRIGTSIDATTTRQIGDRIAGVVEEAAAIVRGLPATGPVEVATGSPRASLWSAIEFDQRRPLWSAAAMTLGMATLLLPDTVRVAGATGAFSVGAGIAASVIAVLLAAAIERAVQPRSHAAHVATLGFRVLLAGFAGSVTILLTGDRASGEVLLAATLLPIVAGLAATIVPTIVGLRRANETVRGEIDDIRAERERVEHDAQSEEARVRAQVTALLHGPIQGRLSACAMALGFHADTQPPPDADRTAFITSSVLDHLAAVARDLEALSAPSSGDGAQEVPS